MTKAKCRLICDGLFIYILLPLSWNVNSRTELKFHFRKGTPKKEECNALLFLFATVGSAFLAHTSEALAAIHRTVGLGLERHTGLAAAVSAGSGEVLTGSTGRILAGVTAGLAALRLVLEAPLCVKLLLTGGEHELAATFLAH